MQEHAELKERRNKLTLFFQSTIFTTLPAEEQQRLYLQHAHMTAYQQVLEERIACFQ